MIFATIAIGIAAALVILVATFGSTAWKFSAPAVDKVAEQAAADKAAADKAAADKAAADRAAADRAAADGAAADRAAADEMAADKAAADKAPDKAFATFLKSEPELTLSGHEGSVNSAAFSPDGKRIVTASEDKTARIWDAASGKPIGEPLKGHDGAVMSAAFSPDGRRIVTASADKTALTRRRRSGTRRAASRSASHSKDMMLM
jgi:dipeptidyl aminopeptidase/acylaminoacyl peptidase